MNLEKLRSVVRDCLGKHLYSSAIFFADKLVTVSGAAAADVYLLAQAYYLSKQYQRALNLLRQEHLLTADERSKYLAARCLAEVKEWDECLAMLGEDEGPTEQSARSGDGNSMELNGEGREINIGAANCLLRGRAYEALDNRTKALFWYKAALRADPYCYEAFEHLFDNRMLSADAEAKLLDSLDYPPEDRWLALLYQCKSVKYGQRLFEERAAALERPAEEAPSTSGSEGWGLRGNGDLLACRADNLYHRAEYQQCYDLTKSVLERDPYHLACMPVHLAAALELKRKNELFLLAHKLVQEYPQKAIAWFAVGCYYYCIRNYDSARRYFAKSTSLDSSFAPAWLGFGNAFAAQDESDQAMAAYRTAARLFPGCHLPCLCIGVEYQKTNNLNLAEQFLKDAQKLCPQDPLIYNELGVLSYRNKDYRKAESWLRKALSLAPEPLTDAWEATCVNLGHSLRKQRKYTEAIDWYDKALGICPRSASTYAALGYTHHLMDQLTPAIEFYHKALGLKTDDTFTAEMLTRALEDEGARFGMAGGEEML